MKQLSRSKPFLWFALAFGALCVVLGAMTFVTPMGQETMTRGLSGALHLNVWMGGVIAVLLGGWFIWRSVRLMKQAP